MAADHYATLGIPPTADQQTVRAAYLARMRAVHPDLGPGDVHAPQAAREVNQAYEVLSDPERRRRYDTLRATRRSLATWSMPAATGAADELGGPAAAEELRRLAATQAAYSPHGVDFRRAFRRAALRFGVALLAVGTIVLFTLAA